MQLYLCNFYAERIKALIYNVLRLLFFTISLHFLAVKLAGRAFSALQPAKPAQSDGGRVLDWRRRGLPGGLLDEAESGYTTCTETSDW
jgi:hypothetical protein